MVFEDEFISLKLENLGKKLTEQELCEQFSVDLANVSSLLFK